MHICIEGTDGAGKATQARLLAERLQPSVLFSFHRYDTPLGALIKRHLMGEVLLTEPAPSNTTIVSTNGMVSTLIANGQKAPEDSLMFQCLATIDKYDAANDIRAAQAEGKHIICDRYTQSALAYGMADGLDKEWLKRIQSSLPVPDLNLFIDVTEEEALRRRPQLRDRYERDREKQRVVRRMYQDVWSMGLSGRWVTIPGHLSVEQVHEMVWGEVMKTASAATRGKK